MPGKILYLVALSVLISIVGNAQLLHSVSLKVAYSSAYQEYDYSTNLPYKKRINVANFGLAAQLFNGSPFALLIQCEYAERGMKDEFILTGPMGPEPIGTVYKYGRVRYLSFPLLVKIHVLKGFLSPYVLAGGRVDFMLGSKSDDDIFKPVYDKFTKSTYGLSGGIGAEFSPLDFLIIQCEGRYNLDLKDSYKTQYLRVRNNSVDIWLGVAFVI